MGNLFRVELIARYQGFRQEAPTVANQLRRNAGTLVRGTSVFVAMAALCWWLDAPVATGVALGFVGATLAQTFVAYVRTRDLWPLIERITDWSEVDRMSRTSADGNAVEGSTPPG